MGSVACVSSINSQHRIPESAILPNIYDDWNGLSSVQFSDVKGVALFHSFSRLLGSPLLVSFMQRVCVRAALLCFVNVEVAVMMGLCCQEIFPFGSPSRLGLLPCFFEDIEVGGSKRRSVHYF